MGYEGLQPPVSSTPQGMYAWASNHVVQLRRILNEAAEAGTDLTALTVRVAALEADAVDGILTPQQAFELSLVTQADSALGSIAYINELRRTRMQENADAAIAAAISANKANVGVRTEVRVRAEEDLALAEQIDTVSAALGVTSASVVTLTQAVSDGDSALGAQITSVQSSVAGNTSQIQVLVQSVDGIYTRYAVTINNNGEITGFIRLDGNAAGTNFTVAADNFYVGKVGTTGGTAVPVFAIQSVNGVSKLTFRGDMIADGTIVARNILAGSITADKLSVSTLSAVTSNLGTITAGLIRNAANTLLFDLPNMRLYRADGTMELNNTFRTVQSRHKNPALKHIGIVANRVNPRGKSHKDTLAAIRQSGIRVMPTVLIERAAVQDSIWDAKPVWKLRHQGASGRKASHEMRAVCAAVCKELSL